MISITSSIAIVMCAFIGAALGSFAGAMVWRIRAREKSNDISVKELQKEEHSRTATDRSCCLRCGETLSVRDLIPVFSWLSLGGKCRYCREPIGCTEIVLELSMAVYTVMIWLIFAPLEASTLSAWLLFFIWLTAGVLMAILFVYDMRWYILPNRINWSLALIGCINFIILLWQSNVSVQLMLSTIAGIVILSGIYGILWLVSSGRWIGLGDVKLGLGLALLLADWRLSFFALFVANLIGVVVVLPGVLKKNVSKGSRIPFGPMMIIGSIVVYVFRDYFIGVLSLSI